jgi:5-methylcytosine-specific restriction protein A
MKKSICPFPGCLKITNDGKYCETHISHQIKKDQQEKERTNKRWENHHKKIDYAWIWHTKEWKELRAKLLKAEPYCVRCGERATVADHVVPHRGNAELAFSANNLQSLCRRCSDIKSREDRDAPNPYPLSENEKPN